MARNRTIPFGYMMQDGEITANPKEVLAVITIFSEYLKGKSLLDIVKLMEVPYSDGAVWNKHMVKRILENEKYLGTDKYPQLIDEETFRAANEKKLCKAKSLCMISEDLQEIQGDYDMLLGMRQALSEMDVEAVNLICSHSLKAVQDPDAAVQHYAKEKERIELMKELQRQWVLGSDEMERYCTQENYFTLVSAPFLSKRQTASHLPFMGEKGMDYLVELKNEFFEKFDL